MDGKKSVKNMKVFSIFRSSFLSGSIISMIEQGFSSITSFLTGIIIARNCTIQDTGMYAFVLSISMIILGLQRVIIVVPFNVHYPKMQKKKSKEIYYSATMGLECLFLLLLGILVYIFGTVIYKDIGGISLAFFFTGYLIKDYGRQFFFGIGKTQKCLLMSIVQCFVQLSILLLFRNSLTLEVILSGIGISCIGCTVFFLIPYIQISLKKAELQKTWETNWWTAKWSIGISMSDSLKNQLSIWLLNFFQSVESVAIYNNNNTLATLPQPIFVGLSQFLLPNLSASIHYGNSKETIKKIYGACFITATANIFWSLILLFIGRWIIIRLYGDAYYIGSIPLIVCCIRGIFVSLNNVQNAVLQAYGKPQIILYTLLIGVSFLLTVGTVMIWKMGIIGVCLVMLIVYVIPVILQFYSILRLDKI